MLLYCCCLFSFHRNSLILDLKRDWREKTIRHDKFDNGSGTRASNGNVHCLHLLIGHRVWQQKRLPCWRGPSVNLALGERFHRQWLGCQPLCPKQGIVSAEECSAILADPRCVLNIKSSAVIPLAAPNTNRGLPVAVATALLSNIASSSSASLWISLFSFTSLLFAHVFFLLGLFFFFVRRMCNRQTMIRNYSLLLHVPSPFSGTVPLTNTR